MKFRHVSATFFVVAIVFLGGCASSPQKPQMTESEKQDKVAALNLEAEEDVEEQNYAVALLRYEQALELDTNNLTALVGAGDVAYAIEKYSDALVYYERALANDAEDIRALEGRALSNLKLQQFVTAKEQLQDVLHRDETRWRSLNALGILADLDSNYEKAQGFYNKALELNPDNVRVMNNLGYSLIMNHEYKKAESVLQKAFNLDQRFFRVRNNYAIAMAWQKRYEDAIELLAAAVPYEVAYNNVGYIAYLNNDYVNAKIFLKKALNASPSYYPEAAKNLESVEKAEESIKRTRSLPQ